MVRQETEGTSDGLSIASLIRRLGMMCIISKERIAFCAQVEGTRGAVFTVSPIALQFRCKHVPNEPIPMYGQTWLSTPECSFKIGDRQSEKKLCNCDGRATCYATGGIDAGLGVSRHRGVSDGSDGARQLSRSHSARMELSFADDASLHYNFIIFQTLSYFLTDLNVIFSGR